MKTGLWLSRRHVRWMIVLLALLPILPTVLMVQMMLQNAVYEQNSALSEMTGVYRSELIDAVARLEISDDVNALPEGLSQIFSSDGVALRVLKPGGEVVFESGPHLGDEPIIVKPGKGNFEGWTVMLDASKAIPDAVSDLERATWWQAFWIVVGVVLVAGVVWFVVHRGLRIDELRSDMVTTVSHEIKTPIATMKVLLETLTESDFLDAKGRADYLELLVLENGRLERLAGNFLTFSRLKKGEIRLKREVVSVEDAVSGMIELIRPRFEKVGGELQYEIEHGLSFNTDGEALLILLTNLMENGLKYGGNPPSVTISARSAGRKNLNGIIEVLDNGRGIEQRERKAVFRRYFQGDDTLNSRRKGVGLGLAICQRLVKLMHGRIRVEDGPGQVGARFVVVLKNVVAQKPVSDV